MKMVLLQSRQEEKMVLEAGKIFPNRTVKYLVPALNLYGPVLKTKINLVSILGIGLFDMAIEGSHLHGQKNIYFLLNKASRTDLFNDFIRWVSYQEYYVTDYNFDPVENSTRHMVVLAFPPSMHLAYDLFIEGKYSKMYTKNELAEFFAGREAALGIFKRERFAKESFKKKVLSAFGTVLTEEDFLTEIFEYDFPPTKEQEFFNFNE
jgi:hypothetical protein